FICIRCVYRNVIVNANFFACNHQAYPYLFLSESSMSTQGFCSRGALKVHPLVSVYCRYAQLLLVASIGWVECQPVEHILRIDWPLLRKSIYGEEHQQKSYPSDLR